MKRTAGYIWFGLCLSATPVLSQYEDLSLPAAPAEEKKPGSMLQGLKVTRTEGEKGSRDIVLSFLFSVKPSVYFNYYDAQKQAVILDFYDTRLGKARLDTVREAPITRSTADSLQIDLNKEATGLAPDLRDVARVSLFTRHKFDYEVREEGSSIVLSFKWSERKEAAIRRKKQALYWQVPLAAVVAGGAGYAAYALWLKEEPAAETDILGPNPGPHPAE